MGSVMNALKEVIATEVFETCRCEFDPWGKDIRVKVRPGCAEIEVEFYAAGYVGTALVDAAPVLTVLINHFLEGE